MVKKLRPNQRGAVALTRQYGEALVCVRHRQDPAGAYRYTTVELLVERRPIAARNQQVVGVEVDFHDAKLRAMLKTRGARWDPQLRVWKVARKAAAQLGLQDRIVMAL